MTETPNTVTLPGGELFGMLTDLARTAEKVQGLPVLEQIRLHVDSGVLHGWSTNRFVAAHATAKCDGHIDGAFYLPAAEVKRLGMLRTASFAKLTLDASSLEVSDFETTLTVARAEHDYPDVARVVGDQPPEAGDRFAFDGKYMAEIAAVAKRRKEYAYAVPSVAARPLHVQIGENYRAWLMPVRMETPEWLPNSWTGAAP